MPLQIHDSATRSTRVFVPASEGKASIYVCGLTVQSEPHVGHVRSAVNFDILRRWLIHPQAGPTPRDCLCYSIVKDA